MSLLQKILFVLVILLSIWLRVYHYSYFPQRGATSDEYTYSFLGTSLLTKGMPVSWSAFQAYHNREDVIIDHIYFPIVSPYFDHPPGYALTLGMFLLGFEQEGFTEQKLETIRLFPILMTTLTGIILFFLIKREYSFAAALLTLVLYSTVTIFVMNQRVSVAENQLALLFVTALLLFSRWKHHLSWQRVFVLGVIAGAAFLTKILGGVLFVILLCLFFRNNLSLRQSALLTASFLLCASLLFVYAALYNWNLFWEIQGLQSGRDIGPQALWMLVLQPVIVNKVYYDGWYFLGFVSLGFLSREYKKHLLLLIPAGVYFFTLLASLSKTGQSGWYLIPLFPFMAAATSLFLLETLRKKSMAFFLVCILVGIPQLEYFYDSYFGLSPFFYRILLGLLCVPLLLLILFKKDQWFGRISVLYLSVMLLTTIAITYRYVHPS
ncbi:MAG: hypothetical protein RLZZ455_55 [Candidatus Parcubacteria bacterium]